MTESILGKNRRVLVIDDNPAIHEDFRKILGGNPESSGVDLAEAAFFDEAVARPAAAGFEMDSALQGQEGLEKVRAALAAGRPYAMAFIDVRMPPGWDGIETTAKIWETYPDLQVVICTAYSDYSWDGMLAKVGQSDRLVILKKPFDNIEVLQLTNALTEKWRLLQEVKLKIGNLEEMVASRTAELRESEELFRLIAENVDDLITLIDKQGRRLYSSPSLEKILGYSPAELKNSSAFAQAHCDDQCHLTEAVRKCVETGIQQALECRMQKADGSWCILEAHVNAIHKSKGEVAHLVIVQRDISERKRSEENRKKMEVQLRHAQKMESIGQLAAGIAHEINTPAQYVGDNIRFLKDAFGDLNRVLLCQTDLLQAVKSKTMTDDLVARVEQAMSSADVGYLALEIPKAILQTMDGIDRVSKIVHAMKEFSHPGTHEKTLLDLNHAIESTLLVCQNEWKYVADLVCDFDQSLPHLSCLPGEINQMILNIVVNAAHAIGDVVGVDAKKKGTITMSTRHDGGWVEIRIGDTGTGIPKDVQLRIFDPFFTTKGVGKGTGQGLAIAHSVVSEKHAGTITVESEMGRGTTFIVRLPLVV